MRRPTSKRRTALALSPGLLLLGLAGCLVPNDPSTGRAFLKKADNQYVVVIPTNCKEPSELIVSVKTGEGRTAWKARLKTPSSHEIVIGTETVDSVEDSFQGLSGAETVDVLVGKGEWGVVGYFDLRQVGDGVNGGLSFENRDVPQAELGDTENCP